jgi:hypothetical protein
MTYSPVLQLSRRSSFERAVVRAIVGGALGGLVRAGLIALGLALPLWFPTVVGVCAVAARGDRFDRWLLRIAALMGASLCALLPLDGAELCGGAVSGVLLLWSLRCEDGARATMGEEQLGPVNYVLGGLVAAGLCWLGTEVASALAVNAMSLGIPGVAAGVFAGAVLGLFVGLSLATGHLVLRRNPVEARAAEVLPALRGELHAPAQRAVDAYRDCARALIALPSRPEREELGRTISDLTSEALSLSEQWAGIEDDLACTDDQAKKTALDQMERAAASATDPIARAHFALAASTWREEATLGAELRRKRERVVAKLWSQVALLERARTSLLGARSGHVQIRAAELSGLARKLTLLSRTERLDGQLATEVATQAELSLLDNAVPGSTT